MDDVHTSHRSSPAGLRLPNWRQVAGIVATALAFVATSHVGDGLPLEVGVLSPVWIPSGIAVAAVLLGGRWMLAGVFLGDYFVSQATGLEPWLAGALAIGDTLEPLIVVLILQHYMPGSPFQRVRDLVVFLAAVVVATSTSALLGVAWLSLADQLQVDGLSAGWRVYFSSTSTGILLVSPLLVVWAAILPRARRTLQQPVTRRRLLRVGEASVLTALLVTGCVHAFAGDRWDLLGLFLVFPLTLWATTRFGPPGATVAAAIVATIGMWGTLGEVASIAGLDAAEIVGVLQVVISVMASANLLLAASLAERDDARRQLESTLEVLDEAEQLALVGGWRLEVAGDRLDTAAPIWCRQALKSLFGLPDSNDEPTVELLLDHVEPADRARVERSLDDALHVSGSLAIEHRIRFRDTTRIVRHVGRASRNGSDRPNHLVGAVLDITGQKQLDAIKDSLVATASHELRTPLTSILGFAQTLNYSWDELSDADKQQFITIIEERAARLATIIDDTLLQSRVDDSSLPSDLEPIPLEPIIRRALAEVDAPDVEVHVAPGEVVLANDDHLVRVVSNLVSNAHKYGVEPIEVEAHQVSGGDVELRVIDHGAGPSPSFESRMFERFERGDETAEMPGTGLGLSIARGLATSMDATLDYRREDDATVFLVTMHTSA